MKWKRVFLAVALALPPAAAFVLATAPETAKSVPPPAPVAVADAGGAQAQGETEPLEVARDRGPRFDEKAIAPLFTRGKLGQAKERFDNGAYGEAFRLFTEGDDGSPQVAWMRALSALESDRPGEAKAILEGLEKRLPTLKDRIVYHRGIAWERLGDPVKAAAAYRKVPAGSLRKDDARLAQARMQVASDHPWQALETLDPLLDRRPPNWGTDYGAAALQLASEIHLKAGRTEEAAKLLWKLWAEHPLAPQVEDARKKAEGLKTTPTLAQKVANARGILDAHRNREGIEKLEKLLPELKLPSAIACEGRFALGRGYRKQREHSKAIPMLESVVASCKDPALRVRALYVLGQSTSIVAPEKAVSVYETLAKDHPDHSFADDALLFLSEVKVRLGDEKGAREALQRLVDLYPEGDYRADALFRLYWMDRKAGAHERALASLAQLEDHGGSQADPIDYERAVYWHGRTSETLGDRKTAIERWEHLITEHPASYYAMMARGRLEAVAPERAKALRKVASPRPGVEPPALYPGVLRDDPHFLAAVELIRLGFPKLATDELIAIDRKAARAKSGSSDPVLVIAWLLDRVDARRAAHQVTRMELVDLIRGRPEGEAASHFRMAYPLAYRELIERHGKSYEVPADLMQALMREESSLDPEIVSWAGAIGLTQLMPTTANAVARQLKLGKVTNAQLRQPDLNVRLGTAYLGQMLKRWKGNPALAAASYNAGPGAVSRWIADRGHLEIDEFVEEIPIEETRNYVKRVLKSYNAYRLTWGEGPDRFVGLKPTVADPSRRK